MSDSNGPDSLTGPGGRLSDGVILNLNPALAEALTAIVAAEITTDDVGQSERQVAE